MSSIQLNDQSEGVSLHRKDFKSISSITDPSISNFNTANHFSRKIKKPIPLRGLVPQFIPLKRSSLSRSRSNFRIKKKLDSDRPNTARGIHSVSTRFEAQTERLSSTQRTRLKKSFQLSGLQIESVDPLSFLDSADYTIDAKTIISYMFDIIEDEVNKRVKTLKMKQKIALVSDKTKLEIERKKRKKFEEIYGKRKHDVLYSSNDIEEDNIYVHYESWKRLCSVILKLQKRMFVNFEMDFLVNLLSYNYKIFDVNRTLSRKTEIPPILDYFKHLETDSGSNYIFYNIQKSRLTDEFNLRKYTKYIIEVENCVQILLHNLRMRCIQCEEVYKKEFIQNKAEGIKMFRSRIVKIVHEWNLQFLNDKLSGFKNEGLIKDALKSYFHSRVDAQLLNLRQAMLFFNCYLAIKNLEKGYLVLSTAFENNKEGVDIYLDLYIKYMSEKKLLTHFLDQDELKPPEFKEWRIRGIFEWTEVFSSLKDRNQYIGFLLKYLSSYLTIKNLKEIVELLAINAVKTNHFHQAERYYETLLYIYDNIDKMDLIDSQERKEKRFKKNEKVLDILNLNKKYVSINNELINITNKNHSFEKCLSYISNNYFLYHNSVEMINDTDPLKYAKKNLDREVLTIGTKFSETFGVKSEFQNFLNFFNTQFKMTVRYYDELWMSVNKKFSLVSPELYNSIKNCLEILKKESSYTEKTLHKFISTYDYIPSINNPEIPPRPEYWMESYFPRYTGFIDAHQSEVRIITKLNYVSFKGMKKATSKKHKRSFEKDTVSSGRKKGRRLNGIDVGTYYNIKTEHPKVLDILLNMCLFESYREKVPEEHKYSLYSTYNHSLSADEHCNNQLESISETHTQLFYKLMRVFTVKIKSRLIAKQRVKDSKKKPLIKNIIAKKFIRREKPFENPNRLNILTFLQKTRHMKKEDKPSKFCITYKKEIMDVQKRYNLYEYDSRVNKSEASILSSRRYSLGYNDNHLNIIERDKFNLSGRLKDHYFNMALVKKREAEENRIRVMLRGKKEDGDYVHIEDSIKKINSTRFRVHNSILNKQLFTNVEFKIKSTRLEIHFDFLTEKGLKGFETEMYLELNDNLSNCKEEIIKLSRIKFQSYWPILHKIFGERLFKGLIEEFSYYSPYYSENTQEIHYHLLDSMAFIFPIILTKLKTYPLAIVKAFNLEYFEKYDLDAIQCICTMIFFLLNTLLPSIEATNLNSRMPRMINFNDFVKNIAKKSGVNLFEHYIANRSIQIERATFKYLLNEYVKNITEKKDSYRKIKETLKMKTLILYIDTLYYSLMLSKQLRSSANIFGPENKRAELFERLTTGFCAKKVIKLQNGGFIQLDLQLVVNFEYYEELKQQLNSSYKKTIKMMSVSNTQLDESEFLLLFWLLSSEKLFGFTVTVSDFKSLRLSNIKKNKRTLQYSIYKDEIWSMIELPKMDRSCNKDYLTFLQVYWLTQNEEKLRKLNHSKENISWFGLLSKEFDSFDLFFEVKNHWIRSVSFLDSFYSKPFKSDQLRNTWEHIDEIVPVRELLYERALINEIFESSDGQIIKTINYPIFEFDYSHFHKFFNIDNKRLIQKLSDRIKGQGKLGGMRLDYLSGLFNIINLFSLKSRIEENKHTNKRMRTINSMMLKVKQQFKGAEEHGDNEKHIFKLDRNRNNFMTKKKVEIKDRLFLRNFERLNYLSSNKEEETRTIEIFAKESHAMKLKNGELIISNKNKQREKKQRNIEIQEDFYGGNIKQGEEYSKKLSYFRRIVWEERIDFRCQYSKILRDDWTPKNINHQVNEVRGYRNLLFNNNKMLKKGSDFVYSRLQLRYSISLRILPYKNLMRFLAVPKISLQLYIPMLGRQSTVTIKEPSTILRLLRLLTISSSKISDNEIYWMFVRHLSMNTPKNTFLNLDKYLNLEYFPDANLFSMAGIELGVELAESSESSITDFGMKDLLIVEERDRYEHNAWVQRNTSEFIDARISLGRITFRLMKGSKDSHKYQLSSNIEGFLNSTLQSSIDSQRLKTTDIKSLTHSRVKEMLCINDPFSNNTLTVLRGIKSHNFFILQELEGMGLCEIKVSTFYATIERNRDSINPESNNIDDIASPTIHQEFLLEEIAYRITSKLFKQFKLIQLTSEAFSTTRKGTKLKSIINSKAGLRKGGRLWMKGVKKIIPRMFKPRDSPLEKSRFAIPSQNISLLRRPLVLNNNDFGPMSESFSLFKEEEYFLLNYTILSKGSRFRCHKIVLNSKDINSMFILKQFLEISFKNESYQKILLKLSQTNPKQIVLLLLRYLISKFTLTPSSTYSSLSQYRPSLKSAVLSRNIFTRYEHNTKTSMSPFLDRVTDKRQVLFKGFKAIGGSYFVVTVVRDTLQKHVVCRFYNPRTCRNYTLKLIGSDLLQPALLYLDQMLAFAVSDDFGCGKDFQEFCRRFRFDQGRFVRGGLRRESLVTSFVERESIIFESDHFSEEMNSSENSENIYPRKQAAIQNFGEMSPNSPTSDLAARFGRYLHMEDFIAFIKDLDTDISLTSISSQIHHLQAQMNILPSEEEFSDVEERKLAKTISDNKQRLHAYCVMKFWEQLIAKIKIQQEDNGTRVFYQQGHIRIILIETILMKTLQLSPKSQMSVEVGVKHKRSDTLEADNIYQEQFERIIKSNSSMFSRFIPIEYQFTSYFFLELCVITSNIDEDIKSEPHHIVKRRMNLREVLNLQLAEKSQRTVLTKSENRVSLNQLHDLANFLIFKVKTSNIFNISLTMKRDEKAEEEEEERFADSKKSD